MKRIITTLLALALGCAAANAQYNSVSFETSEPLKIVQIDELENSVIVFFTYTAQKDGGFCNWNDSDSYVTVAGSYTKYKVLSVAGIPTDSIGGHSYFRKAGDRLNFAVEFEKFPLDGPFEIIETTNSERAFNFSSVTVNKAEKTHPMPVQDFLDFTSIPVTGTYYDDGDQMRYWSEGGITMTMHFVESNEYGKLFKIYLEVVNDSGRPVDLITSNIKVTAEKKGRTTNATVLSFNDFDQRVVNNLGWSSTSSTPASRLSDDMRWRSNRLSREGDQGAAVAFGALSLLATVADGQHVNNIQNELNAERDRAVSNYLLSNTLKDGSVYGGFVAVKDTNPEFYHITLKIAGKEYFWHCQY